MSYLITALAFFLLLTVLVLIHELGHYAMARRAGVEVEEFGFGLPPRIRTLFWRGKTRFSLNAIPFGGFVRLKGENAVTERERTARGSFAAASFPARIAILTAGVAMNFLFAILIFTIGFSVGRWVPTYLSYEAMRAAAENGEIHMVPGVLIDEVIKGGAAESLNLPLPSILEKIDGHAVSSPEEVIPLQEGKKQVTYTLLSGKDFTVERTVVIALKDGKTGVSLRWYPRELSAPSRSVFSALRLAFREAGLMTVQTVYGMGELMRSLVTTARIPEGITGIVGIAQLTNASVQEGFMQYLRLVGLLSLSLAALNILPLPALDGGRLLFVLVELVRGKPVNRTFELRTNAVGFALLLLLIVLITYHDVARLF